jgi:hypothetical protein
MVGATVEVFVVVHRDGSWFGIDVVSAGPQRRA